MSAHVKVVAEGMSMFFLSKMFYAVSGDGESRLCTKNL